MTKLTYQQFLKICREGDFLVYRYIFTRLSMAGIIEPEGELPSTKGMLSPQTQVSPFQMLEERMQGGRTEASAVGEINITVRKGVAVMNHKSNREKWKKVELTKECKAILTLLIREVQDCKTDEELNALLKSWIDANGLHPEKVEQWQGREA